MSGIQLDEWNGSKGVKDSIETLKVEVKEIADKVSSSSELTLRYTKRMFLLTVLIAVLTIITTIAAIITIRAS